MSNLALLKQVKAVSFDLDDTFWDCAPVIISAENALSEWLQQHYPEVVEANTLESMTERKATIYETHPHLASDVTAMRKALIRTLFENRQNATELTDQAFDVFYRARSQVTLYDGTENLLKALKSTHKLAAITNGNADLDLVGIAHYFDDVLRASLQHRPKPDSHMFDTCCSNLGIAASELLHVGDNGHNAGVLTVWFNQIGAEWPSELPRATFEVSSLPELQELLSQKLDT